MPQDKKTNVQTGDTLPHFQYRVRTLNRSLSVYNIARYQITKILFLIVCFLPLKNLYKENSRLHAKEMGMGNKVVKWDDVGIFGKITEPEI